MTPQTQGGAAMAPFPPPGEQIRNIIGDPLNYRGGGIYQIILLDTERCYVGRSICVSGRLFEHVSALLANKHYNSKLQRAWNKYGPGRFAFKILQRIEGEAMVKAEQAWIDHFQAASFGLNIRFEADPYNAIVTDPNYPKYKHALEAISLAQSVAQCARLRSEPRATLKDCLRWNAYALAAMNGVPSDMIKAKSRRRFDAALSYANERINSSCDAALLPYIEAPESFPHDAPLSPDRFMALSMKVLKPLSDAWQEAAMTMWKQRAAEIAGPAEVKRQWAALVQWFRGDLLGDGNFMEWCREIGAKQPSAHELRAAGLVTWE